MFKKKNREETPAPGAQNAQGAGTPGGRGLRPFLRRNWKRLAAGAVVVAVAAALLLPKDSAPASGSIVYAEASPARRDITNTFSDSGTIMAANTYEVKPLVRGTVLTAEFEEGDMVQEGDHRRLRRRQQRRAGADHPQPGAAQL